MGFTTGDLPPVDPETFLERPFFERIRILVDPLGRVRLRHARRWCTPSTS